MDLRTQPEGPEPLDKSPKRSLEEPTEEEEKEEEARASPGTRSQTQARKKKVTFNCKQQLLAKNLRVCVPGVWMAL
ncbi:MAG: hypothetical protein GY696_17425 [Gammaproteobacteria bacterium]|nr:hypothetical protein [Gammaproteobacteria bacterium]